MDAGACGRVVGWVFQDKDWTMGNAGPLPPPRHPARNSLSKEDYRAALQQQMEDKRAAELYHRAMVSE